MYFELTKQRSLSSVSDIKSTCVTVCKVKHHPFLQNKLAASLYNFQYNPNLQNIMNICQVCLSVVHEDAFKDAFLNQ